LDNRSFRLNFEITAFSTDRKFVDEVEAMLVTDFARSKEATVGEFTRKSFLFRAACRAARLVAPIQ
jgi:cardiolipin synthase